MGRTKHQFCCDDTMTKCDGMPQRDKFVIYLFSVCYLYASDDEGKKKKTLFLTEITRLNVRKLIYYLNQISLLSEVILAKTMYQVSAT